MHLWLLRTFLLVNLSLTSTLAFSLESAFDGLNCPEVTCEEGSCSDVQQCFYVDSTAPHCSVTDGENVVRCSDIQSRNLLNGEGQCNSLGQGSRQQPWCSIEQATSSATAGSLVLIAPGRYLVPGGTHGLNNFTTQATPTRPIVFRNAAFDPNNPTIPEQQVTLTPFNEVSGWQPLSEGNDYLICKHAGIADDASTFNGIATNIRHSNHSKPLMRLFNEGCGVADSADATNRLTELNGLADTRTNAQGHYVQIWNEGEPGGSSHCPTVKKSNGEIAVQINKTNNVQSCADLSLSVTATGYTVHLQSTGDLCGDLEEILENQNLGDFNDNEPDHIRFEGLTIEAGSYGITIETDGIALSYSRIQGAYKDAIKAISNEPWDYRAPNQCGRLDNITDNNQIPPSVQDLIQFCKTRSGPMQIGSLVNPPACEEDDLDIASLAPEFFYWQLDEESGRQAMRSARDANIDGHCVGEDCMYQSRQHLQRYCREVVPTFNLDNNQQKAQKVPDNCHDFYYFNAQNVSIHNNDIRYNGEEGIDITGGDNWTISNNTIHDSVVTHGAGQLPAGILSKNVSHHNVIESNLLYNIHHSVTGILVLGGSPSKIDGAVNVVARNNVLISNSGEKILHIPNCTNCAIAHNLVLDTIIGEKGSRSFGLLHVGGNRRSCVTSAGTAIDCGGEKRSAQHAGKGNSVVNNTVELLKWRDVDAYRLLSFGGYKADNQSEYVYNGDKSLCVDGNHIQGGTGITHVTTHTTETEVPSLACALSQARIDAGVNFAHPRVAGCIDQINQGQLAYGELATCLTDEDSSLTGSALIMMAPAVLTDLGLSTTQNTTRALGSCSNNQYACTTDAQCGTASCIFDTSEPSAFLLGPSQRSNDVAYDNDLSWTHPLNPVLSSTVNAYPQFSWKSATSDIEFKFLLYRFHPSGGTNNASWYELLANDTVPTAHCSSGNICSYTAPHLLTDGTYTWKVKRHTPAGWSNWSETQVFFVNEPERIGHTVDEATGLVAPLLSEHVANNPTLTWQHDPYAKSYSLLLYRYDGGYQLLVNLKLDASQLACDYVNHCQITVDKLLQRMDSSESILTPGTYTWKTKKWTENTPSSWNNPTYVFYVD